MTGDAALAGPADVHVEDQGPPDSFGRVEAVVRLAGRVVCRMHYAAFPQHLVFYETHWEPDAPANAEAVLVERLLDLYPERRPERITHAGVTSMATLRWYQACDLRDGVVVCGSYGSRALFYDPIRTLDLAVEPEPMMEGMPAATLTVMYIHDLRNFHEVTQPTLDDVYRWLTAGDHLGRFVAIRRLVVDTSLDPEVVRAALYLSMLNENSGVRQFAAIHLGGYFADLEVRADVARLASMLEDPLRIWDVFGRRPEPDVADWNPAQTRRNGRYAIGWTLGNICWNAMAWGAVPWAEEEAEAVRALIREGAATFTPERDRFLYDLALRDFQDGPDGRFGFGVPEPLSAFDFVRFSVLRWGIVGRLGLRPVDRFYWLTQTCEGIIGAGPDGENAWTAAIPEAALLYAPPPSDALPEGVTEMPEWMYGRNHLELGEPVQMVDLG